MMNAEQRREATQTDVAKNTATTLAEIDRYITTATEQGKRGVNLDGQLTREVTTALEKLGYTVEYNGGDMRESYSVTTISW